MSTKSKWFISFILIWLSALLGTIIRYGLHEGSRIADYINFAACVLMAFYVLTDCLMSRVFKDETYGQALRRNIFGSGPNMTQEDYWEKTGTTPEYIKRRKAFRVVK
jgi:hypothetical protein